MKLTALEPEDLDVLYEMENDPALWSVGGYHVPFSRYDLRDYILNQQHDIYADKQLRMVIRMEDDSHLSPLSSKLSPFTSHLKPIGLVDLFNFSPENMRAELGIAILPEEQGRGYSVEALRLMLDYCRDHLHLHQVYCIVPEDNVASLAMLQKAGFGDTVTLPHWIRIHDKWINCKQMFYKM